MPEQIRRNRFEARQSRLALLASLTDRRTLFSPVYGCDLIFRLSFLQHPFEPTSLSPTSTWRPKCEWTVSTQKPQSRLQYAFLTRGHEHCLKSQLRKFDARMLFAATSAQTDICWQPWDLVENLKDTLSRYSFCVPSVRSPIPKLVHDPSESLVSSVTRALSPKLDILHQVVSRQCVQFPDTRLIQYDCGKLQSLDILLRRLKQGKHRVLIFTQMARVLDILEQFLSFHGHVYLRLDGSTKVEMRQQLMERFNEDSRIFVFILSTRSGGLGVNLTGADTVVFYDSDWNPTMDAQAQDRCHRIGQTRDVHIYRLVSERTVEENILKKANQKRWLNDLAIEGGNFTEAYFKKNTLIELFEEPSGLQDLVKQSQKRAQKKAPPVEKEADVPNDVELALEEVEDDTDREAAEKAKKETVEDLAEFDENILWDESEARWKEREQKVERQLKAIENDLTPLERFALGFLESNHEVQMTSQLQQADVDLTEAKREWELEQLKSMREKEETQAELEEDDMFLCYGRVDFKSQVRELEALKEAETLEEHSENLAGDSRHPSQVGSKHELLKRLGIKNIDLTSKPAASVPPRKKIFKHPSEIGSHGIRHSASESSLGKIPSVATTAKLPLLIKPKNHHKEEPATSVSSQPSSVCSSSSAGNTLHTSSSVPSLQSFTLPSQPTNVPTSNFTTHIPQFSPVTAVRPITLVTRQIVIPDGQVIQQQFFQSRPVTVGVPQLRLVQVAPPRPQQTQYYLISGQKPPTCSAVMRPVLQSAGPTQLLALTSTAQPQSQLIRLVSSSASQLAPSQVPH